MTRTNRSLLIAACLASLASATLPAGCASTSTAAATNPNKMLVNRDKHNLALQGYDPVAYFTDGKPIQGRKEFHSTHAGTTYQFASAQHKQMFDGNPAMYEPRFGGYCGYAASINKVSPIDPNFWEVLDGELVLQHNQKAWDLWHKDVPGNLKKAHANWPGLVARKGK